MCEIFIEMNVIVKSKKKKKKSTVKGSLCKIFIDINGLVKKKGENFTLHFIILITCHFSPFCFTFSI